MAFIAGSKTKISVAATRFRSAVSESVMQLMGGAINYLIDSQVPIGSVIYSMLTEEQFQGQTSEGWVLADGRDCSTSDYALLTGNTTVPDLRYVFIRGKANGRVINPPADEEITLGDYRGDTFQDHKHVISASRLEKTGGPLVHDDGSEYVINGTNTTDGSQTVGAAYETKPKNVTLNAFFRIN